MANRIEGNVYIIDSALNNVALPFPSAEILSISAWFSGQTGEVRFSGIDTTNVISRLVATTGGIASNAHQYFGGLSVDELKVPVLTAGTAWIYFK